jgi:hypothetical protein
MAGESLPSFTWEIFLPGSWTSVKRQYMRALRDIRKGTHGNVPFSSIGGTFLVVEGDSVDMGQEAMISFSIIWCLVRRVR